MTVATAEPSVAAPAYRQPTRRGTELVVLVVGFAVAALGYIQVDLAVLGRLDDTTLQVLGIAGGMLLVVHVVVRVVAPYADPLIYPIAATLNLLGLDADPPPRPR